MQGLEANTARHVLSFQGSKVPRWTPRRNLGRRSRAVGDGTHAGMDEPLKLSAFGAVCCFAAHYAIR